MELIDNRDEIINKSNRFIENLDCSVFILGTNKYGLCVAEWLSKLGFLVGGFINDFTKEEKFGRFDILKSSSKLSNFAVINCIVEGRTIDAHRNIVQIKPRYQIDYFALQMVYPDDLIQVDFLHNTDLIIDEFQEYIKLESQLADEESKRTFRDISMFRLNRSISYLAGFSFRIKEQYFEPFIKLKKYSSFIDGGGFDGETSKSFVNLVPDYNTIYYFEPNKLSFIESKEKLTGVERIFFFNKGLWNKTERLFFDDTLGPASKVTKLGTSYIDAIAIDDVVKTNIDFIKLDIEGAEFNALKGAKKLIKKYKPALAVCVYHNQNDFVRIPDLVLNYNSSYKIYLRHYTQGVFETVMYFV